VGLYLDILANCCTGRIVRHQEAVALLSDEDKHRFPGVTCPLAEATPETMSRPDLEQLQIGRYLYRTHGRDAEVTYLPAVTPADQVCLHPGLVRLPERHDLTSSECMKWRLLLIVNDPHPSVAALDSRMTTRVVAGSVYDSFQPRFHW